MIRRAALGDMDAIFGVHSSAIRNVTKHYSAVELDAWSGRKSPEAFAKTVASKVVLVDEDEHGIRGFAQVDLDSSIVEAVYVAPRYLRRGIGSRLLAELESVAERAGMSELTLDASLNSVGFYEQAGYGRVADSLHELCAGTSIACVVMKKRL